MLAPDLAERLTDPDPDPDPDPAAQLLGEHWERELAGASQALGIGSARFLGGAGRWWDSGVAGEASNQRAGRWLPVSWRSRRRNWPS